MSFCDPFSSRDDGLFQMTLFYGGNLVRRRGGLLSSRAPLERPNVYSPLVDFLNIKTISKTIYDNPWMDANQILEIWYKEPSTHNFKLLLIDSDLVSMTNHARVNKKIDIYAVNVSRKVDMDPNSNLQSQVEHLDVSPDSEDLDYYPTSAEEEDDLDDIELYQSSEEEDNLEANEEVDLEEV